LLIRLSADSRPPFALFSSTSVIIRRGAAQTQQIRPRFATIAALLLLLGPATALADQLDVGKQLYHELDYEAARVALLRGASSTDPHRRAEAYLYLGLIDTVEGDDHSARESFRSGLVLDPQLELPLGTSPKVAKIFNKVRSELARASAERPPEPAATPVQAARGSAAAQPVLQPVPERVLTANGTGEQGGEVAKPAAQEPSHGGRWAAGTLFILGLAAEGAAIYFATQEQAAESAFHNAKYQTDAVKAQSNANQNAVIADVLYASGGVVGFTGVGLWFAF
jgi:hypothetical protein